jgi:hypothetical protein
VVNKGQSIDTFFEMRDELKVFLTNFHLSDRLYDDEFLTRLAYLGNVSYHLNNLNRGFTGTLRNYIQSGGQRL